MDPYEIQPGTPRWFPIQGMDSEGQVLNYTIQYKKSDQDDVERRPIEFMLIERSLADQNPTIDIAREYRLHWKTNITGRMVGEYRNGADIKVVALFYNEQREGDDEDYDNASVFIRFDYYLVGEEEDEGSPFLVISMVLALVIIVILLVILLIRRFKRGRKDAAMFFNPEQGPYYVVRALLDSRIFYLDPNQYSELYSSGRLNEFEFLGTSPRIGGTIIPPESQDVLKDQGLVALTAMPMTPVPVGQPMEGLSPQEGTVVGDTAPMDGTAVMEMGSAPVGTIGEEVLTNPTEIDASGGITTSNQEVPSVTISEGHSSDQMLAGARTVPEGPSLDVSS